MNAAAKLADRIATLTLEQIADVMVGLMNTHNAEADAVFDACLRAAEDRMPSGEFLALCARLEAAA
jgi:hypothetical protein